MLQVATFRVPKNRRNVINSSKATAPEGQINFNKDSVIIFWEDGTKEISDYFQEPAKLSLYAKAVKTAGVQKAYQYFSEVKQDERAKAPAKLFIWKCLRAEQKRAERKWD